jgi:glyoxylase-like metal-dependent hydrolase (beta-lactamase superfamily II)
MAQDVIRRIREVTDKPIKYVVLSHYHAVRVLGAAAYQPEHIIASQDTRDLIVERGEQDKASEIGRFPRLFRNVESVPPGMTWPTMTFTGKMTLWLGKLEVQLIQLGRGHTKGDTVVWLPQDKVLFSGDLVEFDATPYAGDAYFQDWPKTLDNIAALQPQALVPGRGAHAGRAVYVFGERMRQGNLINCAHGTLGYCLIRRDLFEVIPFRWGPHPIERGVMLSEDPAFAADALKQYGAEWWIDASVTAEHRDDPERPMTPDQAQDGSEVYIG